MVYLGLDIWFLTADILLELKKTHRQSNVVLQILLCTNSSLALVLLVLLDVQADRGATAACTRQAGDDTAAIVELDIQTLVLGHAAVQIGVGEVASVCHLAARDGGAHERAAVGLFGQVGNKLVGALAVNVLVVVPGEEGTAVGLPEFVLDRGDAGRLARVALGNTSNNVEPGHNGPHAVLLPDVVATCSEALFTTNGHLLVVEQVAEELPARGHFVALQTLRLGDQVHGSRGGHGAGKAVDTLVLEPGDELGVVRNDSQAVTGRHKGVGAVDHVTVTVTVTGSAKVNTVLVHVLDELVGIHQVGVRVTTAKVRLRHTVHRAAARQSQLLDEDIDAVGACHTVHTIKEDLEVLVGAQELLDQIEIEDLLQHGHIVRSRVDNLDLQWAIGLASNVRDLDVRNVGILVGGQGLGGFVDLVGHGLRSRSSIGKVILDTKVIVGTCLTQPTSELYVSSAGIGANGITYHPGCD